MAGIILDPSDENVEAMDEGWWSAIIAEEQNFLELDPESTCSKPVLDKPDCEIDWNRAQELFTGDCILNLTIQGCNRGGVLVFGDKIHGFVPVSHLIDIPSNVSETERKQILSRLVGKSILAKIIECDPIQERIVFSERAARTGNGKRNELFNSLQTGKTISGTITNITDFGAFVDLGGLEGLDSCFRTIMGKGAAS